MDRMSWPDNDCHVDRRHTTLHGHLTLEDIQHIRNLFANDVQFSATICAEAATRYLNSGKPVGHYIDCKTDNPGFAALMAEIILSEGRFPVRGEGCFPYVGKVYR